MKPILVLQQVPHETLGTLERCLGDAGLAWRYVELFRRIPDDLDVAGAAGMVVLGGPMEVGHTDRYPFLSLEIEWIRQALDGELPLLGICLGAQLLAKVLGARVCPNAIKEIGWYEIDLTPEAAEDKLFGGCGPRQTVFEWHGDTFDLPGGAVLLAKSELCPHQAFRYRSAAWGVQFHVEMTAAMIDLWLDDPRNRRELAALGYIDPEAIRDRTSEALPKMQALGRRVLPAFTALCRQRAFGAA